jgi:hypothetical protein
MGFAQCPEFQVTTNSEAKGVICNFSSLTGTYAQFFSDSTHRLYRYSRQEYFGKKYFLSIFRVEVTLGLQIDTACSMKIRYPSTKLHGGTIKENNNVKLYG